MGIKCKLETNKYKLFVKFHEYTEYYEGLNQGQPDLSGRSEKAPTMTACLKGVLKIVG